MASQQDPELKDDDDTWLGRLSRGRTFLISCHVFTLRMASMPVIFLGEYRLQLNIW